MVAGMLEPKRLELLLEIAPNTSTVHILVNPNNAGVLQDIPAVAAIAGKIGLVFEVVQAGTESEIDTAFATLSRDKAQALMTARALGLSRASSSSRVWRLSCSFKLLTDRSAWLADIAAWVRFGRVGLRCFVFAGASISQ
jgi:hypothetical protein